MSNQQSRTRLRVQSIVLSYAALLAMLASACSQAPDRALTTEQKEADIKDFFSRFEETYAPLEYKQNLLKFNWADLKDATTKKAVATTSNEDYYKVAYEFVARFADAHTSATLQNNSLPGTTEIATLGFSGVRYGDALIVKSLLPSYRTASFYPIHAGDLITKLDGKSLKEIVDQEIKLVRDLGNTEANYTYHFPRLFTRQSTTYGVPKASQAVLTVMRGGKPIEVTVPWVKKDLVDFLKEQNAAEASLSSTQKSPSNDLTSRKDQFFNLAQMVLDGKVDLNSLFVDRIAPGKGQFNIWNTFVFWDSIPTWDSELFYNASAARAMGLTLPKEFAVLDSPLEEFKAERSIPGNAFWLTSAQVYPTYINREARLTPNGIKSRWVGTMYLNTFSPGADEGAVIQEVASTIAQLQSNGVNDLIIDMIDNGGGSLSLGARLAALFSNQKITLPQIEIGIVPDWVGSMYSDMNNTNLSSGERDFAAKIYKEMKPLYDSRSARLLSRRSLEEIMPYQVSPNYNLAQPMRVVLLVNEMCASMCDIFSGIMQDNKLAVILGARTMGAGGNVVRPWDQTDGAHFTISQTESLMVRDNGTYIENVGVTPDIALPVNETAIYQYAPVREKAVDVLLNSN